MNNKQLAQTLALVAHNGQNRKDGEPYVHHPMRVAEMVEHYFPLDKDAPIVALLHDVVEDSPYTLETLRLMGFNSNIVTAVDLLTRPNMLSREAYLTRLLNSGNATALRVKLMDAIDNSTWGYEDRFQDPKRPDAWISKRLRYRNLTETLYGELLPLNPEIESRLMPRIYYVWEQIDRKTVKDFRLAQGEREAQSIHIGCISPHAALIDDIQYFAKGWHEDAFDVVILEAS